MDRLYKTPHYFYIALLAVVVTACGASSLLWKTTYDSESVDIAVDAALDAEGNLYIVGSNRADPQSINVDYSGLILKYDADGNVLWQSTLPEVTHVHKVQPLNERRILIETTTNWLYGIQSSGSVHLASATDGSIIRQLSDEAETLWTETVVDQERIVLLNKYRSNNEPENALQQFDMNGNPTNNLPLSGSPLQIAAIPNGGLYYLGVNEWQPGLRLYALDENLTMTWASAELTSLSGLCERYTEANPVTIVTDGNNDILIKCSTRLVKLLNQGELIFAADYSDLMRDEPDGNPELLDVEIAPTFLTLDANNDIFIATTQANYLSGKVGNLVTDGYSLLKSDTLVMKINGTTGERVWSDEINGYLQGTTNGVISDFYYPLAMSIVDDQLQVTVRGFRGDYVGESINQDTSLSSCYTIADLFLPLNTCNLDSVVNAYAKTLYFDVADGNRSNGITYSNDYPTTALTGSDNTLYLIGDSTWEGSKLYIELNAQGLGVESEGEWVELRDNESSIYIEKHRL